jgi:hypothetical protein
VAFAPDAGTELPAGFCAGVSRVRSAVTGRHEATVLVAAINEWL